MIKKSQKTGFYDKDGSEFLDGDLVLLYGCMIGVVIFSTEFPGDEAGWGIDYESEEIWSFEKFESLDKEILHIIYKKNGERRKFKEEKK